jgi:hypothetical protein
MISYNDASVHYQNKAIFYGLFIFILYQISFYGFVLSMIRSINHDIYRNNTPWLHFTLFMMILKPLMPLM